MKILKILLPILLTFLCHQKNFAQDTIQWRSDYKLKWEDFLGKVDSLSTYGAVSNVLIKFSFHNNDKDFTYKIYCAFNKRTSWVRIPTCDGLIHEQGHFDIGEIFARKLRQAVKLYKLNPATVKDR